MSIIGDKMRSKKRLCVLDICLFPTETHGHLLSSMSFLTKIYILLIEYYETRVCGYEQYLGKLAAEPFCGFNQCNCETAVQVVIDDRRVLCTESGTNEL